MIPDGSVFSVPLASVRMSIVQTEISVTSASTQLVGETPGRKYLQWQVIGTNQITVSPGIAAVTYGHGQMFGPGGTGPTQGSAQSFDVVVPTNAFQAICATGQTSTVIVWEGF